MKTKKQAYAIVPNIKGSEHLTDEQRYICHRIASTLMYQKEESDWCQISSKSLRNNIGSSYLEGRKGLIDFGIIQFDSGYKTSEPGKNNGYCQHYRFVDEANSARWILHKVTKPRVVEAILADTRKDKLAPTRRIDRWLQRNVKRIRTNSTAEDLGLVGRHFCLYKIFEEKNADTMPNFSVCSYARRHTPLTRMKKELRKTLVVDGQKLCAWDIKSSQPLWCYVLLREMLGNGEIDINTVITGKKETAKERRKEVPICFQNQLLDELEQFRFVLKTKDFYDYLIEETASLSESHIRRQTIGRDTMKIRLLTFFFNDYSKKFIVRKGFAIPTKTTRLQKFFDAKFPVIHSMIKDIKKDNYKSFAHFLQRLEAYFVYEVVCNRIRLERPDMFLATIHDSFVFKEEDKQYVYDVVMQEAYWLDIPLKLKLDDSFESDKDTTESDSTVLSGRSETLQQEALEIMPETTTIDSEATAEQQEECAWDEIEEPQRQNPLQFDSDGIPLWTEANLPF